MKLNDLIREFICVHDYITEHTQFISDTDETSYISTTMKCLKCGKIKIDKYYPGRRTL